MFGGGGDSGGGGGGAAALPPLPGYVSPIVEQAQIHRNAQATSSRQALSLSRRARRGSLLAQGAHTGAGDPSMLASGAPVASGVVGGKQQPQNLSSSGAYIYADSNGLIKKAPPVQTSTQVRPDGTRVFQMVG